MVSLVEKISLSNTRGFICGFRCENEIIFYNLSLFRWVSIGGSIRGNIKIKKNGNTALYYASIPEYILTKLLSSGRYGEWTDFYWGVQIIYPNRDHPKWECFIK